MAEARNSHAQGSANTQQIASITGDIDFTPVRQLLSSWSLAQYLKTKPPSSVITLSTSATIGQALKTLATNNILSAPVFESATQQYLGFLDMNDLLRALLVMVNVRELTEDSREYKLRMAGMRMWA